MIAPGIVTGFGRWPSGSSFFLVLTLLGVLALPSTNLMWFDGLPLATGPFLCVLALLPMLLGASLREAVVAHLGGSTERIVRVVTLVALVAKAALLVEAPNVGFGGCYASPGRTPEGECELTYDGLRGGFQKETRIDDTIDFGPLAASSGGMAPNPYSTGALVGGVAATSWNLSYLNALRFNVYDAPGDGKTERLPLRVRWRGTIENRYPRALEVVVLGSLAIAAGDQSWTVASGAAEAKRAVVAFPAGRHDVGIEYVWPPDGVAPGADAVTPFGQVGLRYLGDASGASVAEPFRAAPPGVWWRVGALATDLAIAAVVLLLVGGTIAVLGSSATSLAVMLLAAAVYSTPRVAPELGLLPYAAACVLAPLLCLERTRFPAAGAFLALTALAFAVTVSEAPALESVVYRRPGSDWQTYESFARDILARRSLRAGEDVFHYQPGFRYALFALRVLVGDDDVRLATVARVATTWPFVLLHASGASAFGASRRTRAISYALAGGAIVLVSARWLQSALVIGVSEWPTWSLLPIAVTLLFCSDRPVAWTAGAAMLAFSALARVNQLPGIAILVLAALVRQRGSAWRASTAMIIPFLVAAALIPAHNALYGGRAELLPTERGDPDVLAVAPGELVRVADDPTVVPRLLRQFRQMVFVEELPPAPVPIAQVSWLLYGAWLAALPLALFAASGERAWKLLLALCPLGYLSPFVLIKHYNFYPRHLVVGLLALCVSTMVLVATRGTASAAAASPRRGS